LDDPHCGHFYLQSSKEKNTPEVRKFLAIASVTSIPAEAVHVPIMEDDRFLRFGADIRKIQEIELKRIAQFPPLLWRRIASCVGDCHWMDLRNMAQRGALVSVGCLERDTFKILDCEPWCYTQNDITANVETIRRKDPADIRDETTLKACRYLRLGEDAGVIREGLELLKDTPCTVNTVEQGHSSGAQNVKDHAYCENTLTSRLDLHRSRPFYALDKHSKLIQRLENAIERLKCKQPEKTTGRNMFISGRIGGIWQEMENDDYVATEVAMNTLRQSAEDWNSLQEWEQAVFTDLARYLCFNDALPKPIDVSNTYQSKTRNLHFGLLKNVRFEMFGNIVVQTSMLGWHSSLQAACASESGGVRAADPGHGRGHSPVSRSPGAGVRCYR